MTTQASKPNGEIAKTTCVFCGQKIYFNAAEYQYKSVEGSDICISSTDKWQHRPIAPAAVPEPAEPRALSGENDVEKQMAHDDSLIAYLQKEMGQWKLKYHEIERELSACIDSKGELIHRLQDREKDLSREYDLKNEFRNRAYAAEVALLALSIVRGGAFEEWWLESKKDKELKDLGFGRLARITIKRHMGLVWNAALADYILQIMADRNDEPFDAAALTKEQIAYIVKFSLSLCLSSPLTLLCCF